MEENEKLHVMITTWGYPTKTTKGNPFVEDLAKALSSNNVKVVVFLYEFTGAFTFFKKKILGKPITNWKPSDGFIIKTGVSINIFPKAFKQLRKRLILFFMSKALKKYMQINGKPDIIHQHYILNCSPYITEHFYEKFKIPYVLTEHSPRVHTLTKKQVNKKLPPFYSYEQLKQFASKASFRLSPSVIYTKKYGDFFGAEFIEMPNAIPDSFKNIPLKKLETDNGFKFLSIGDLISRKNPIRLVNAFTHQFKGNKEVTLTIAGSGPLEQELIELIRANEIESQVFLLGRISKEKVLEEVDKSNLVVVASDDENLNTSMLEALFRGRPVVSTNCGGHTEVINEKNGCLSEKTDESLGDKMKLAYDNYSKFIPEEISKQVKEKYSEEGVVKRLKEVYTSAIKG